FYLPQRFQVERVECQLLRESFLDRLLRAVLQPLINLNLGWLDWYERRLCHWFPSDSIRYVLRTRKGLVAPPPPLGARPDARRAPRPHGRLTPQPAASAAFRSRSHSME